MSLTIFALPKPFRDHIGAIQRNAITSWTLLRPKPEIILFGGEEGTDEICRGLGLRHVPDITRNEFGTPVLGDVFEKAQRLASHEQLCYVNADIMLLSDFSRALDELQRWPGLVVLAGAKRDLDIAGLWDFGQADWEQKLRTQLEQIYASADERVRRRLKLGADYFVFPRGFYRHMPDLVPRWAWDGWLLWYARARRARLVDATPVVMAIHQTHDHTHIYTAGEPPWFAEEARRNLRLAGLRRYWFLYEATDVLTPSGPKRLRGEKLRVWIMTNARDVAIYRLGPLRHALGLRRATLLKIKQLTREVARSFRQNARWGAQRLVHFMATYAASRRVLNVVYRALSYRGRQRFHDEFSKLFRDGTTYMQRGAWFVEFAGRLIVLPITGAEAWIEWDAALSILGHDADILSTYETLIRSPAKPTVFFDVGASYGMHSLLWLVHGIRTVSFEPNSVSHAYFRSICAANGVPCDIRPVALGADECRVELAYPEREAWLGSVVPDMKDRLGRERPIRRIQVQQMTLDHFVGSTGLVPQLIKIDTEGSEIHILHGAIDTLRRHRPLVIFESFPDALQRRDLYNLLSGVGYQICALPLSANTPPRILREIDFLENEATNYVARPMSDPILETDRVAIGPSSLSSDA